MESNERYYIKNCVDCGNSTNVIDSRKNKFGAIWRKRKCSKCGYTFSSIEVEECMFDDYELLDEIRGLRKQNRELKDKLTMLKNMLEN